MGMADTPFHIPCPRSLTVSETLQYAAALRLPRTMSAEEREDRVERVIAALGLHKCRDTIVGESAVTPITLLAMQLLNAEPLLVASAAVCAHSPPAFWPCRRLLSAWHLWRRAQARVHRS